MMETLLAVAVRPSDGRVGTVSLPLPNTQPLPFACSVLPPAPRWHQSVPLLLGRSPCYPCCYPLTPAAFLVLPLRPLQFPLFFLLSSLSPAQTPPESFPKSHQPKGTRDVPPYECPPGRCMRQHAEGCPCQDLPVLCRNLAAGVMWSS